MNPNTIMLNALVVGFGSIGRRHVNNLLTLPNMNIIICTENTKTDKYKKGVNL